LGFRILLHLAGIMGFMILIEGFCGLRFSRPFSLRLFGVIVHIPTFLMLWRSFDFLDVVIYDILAK